MPPLTPRRPWYGYDFGHWPQAFRGAVERTREARHLETGAAYVDDPTDGYLQTGDLIRIPLAASGRDGSWGRVPVLRLAESPQISRRGAPRGGLVIGVNPRRLRLPVVSAPMFLVSGPELVLAACRAGIVGAFPTPNCRTAAQLDEWMGTIADGLGGASSSGAGPWAVNLITHSSNDRLAEDLRLVAEYRPPLVITALGSPRPVVETVHDYGGSVIGDVVSLRLARKAVEAGADGLACIAAGAGGHTGHLSPFAFVAGVRDFFDGLVIVGGGISTGWGVAGAIAAGADLVYMGTRFLATTESLAAPAYKQMLVDSGSDDVLVSAAITGTPASWLVPSLVANGYDPANMGSAPPPERDYGAMDAPKRWKDIWAAGQGLETIRAIPSVAQVVADIEAEYGAALTSFAERVRPEVGAAAFGPARSPSLL